MTSRSSRTRVEKPDSQPLLSAVVGVLVHNEAPTVETCLRAILAELDGPVPVRSVIVVASGCTDLTEDIVRKVAADESRVRLIVEPERSGKAAAINLLLRESSEPIVVALGGDVVFTPGSMFKLIAPFSDPKVGMTGVRPVPTNARVGFLGRAVNILWDLHHELSLQSPKLGEAVAFRRLFNNIDRGTLVDEAIMEHTVRSAGMELRYVPDAVVRNHGPESLRDFLAQRSRVYRGHMALAASTGYRVSSMSTPRTVRAVWRLWRRGEAPFYLAVTIGLEAIARAHAHLSRLTRRHQENGIWRPIVSSKRVLADGHVLRSHHADLQRLRLGPIDSSIGWRNRTGRASVSRLRSLVRADDRIGIQGGQLAITFRGDEDGARVLGARLEAEVPHLVRILPKSNRIRQTQTAERGEASAVEAEAVAATLP